MPRGLSESQGQPATPHVIVEISQDIGRLWSSAHIFLAKTAVSLALERGTSILRRTLNVWSTDTASLARMKNITTTHKNLGEIVFFSCSLSWSASFHQLLPSGFSSLAQDEALPRRRWADPRAELDQSWPRAPVYDRALSARVRRGHADQAPLLPKWPQHYKAGLLPSTFGFKSANIFKVGDLVSSDYYTGWLWKDDHVSKKDEQGLITARLAKTWPKAFCSCAHFHFLSWITLCQ